MNYGFQPPLRAFSRSKKSINHSFYLRANLKNLSLFISLITFLVIPGSSKAQWSSTPTTAFNIGGGAHPGIVSDGSGGAIVGWFPNANARRVNPSGIGGWSAGVTLGGGFGQQVPISMVSDGAGGAIITWISSSFNIHAQKINAAGVVQWTAGGVAVGANAGSGQLDPSLVSDGAGGAIISWFDRRNATTRIYAQRVNSAGILQWATSGVDICPSAVTESENSFGPRMQSDGSGGAVIAWRDIRNGNNDIYAQRVNATGTSLWGVSGLAVCNLPSSSTALTMDNEASGDAVISWHDNRNGNSDIYAQRLDASGTPQWTANGLAICTTLGSQYNPKIYSRGGEIIIGWLDDGGRTTRIHAQKLNYAGTLQWETGGATVCPADGGKSELAITTDQNGGAILTWMDVRNTTYDIYAQRIDAAGSMLWGIPGLPIATFGSSTGYPSIVSNGVGGAIIAFNVAPANGVFVQNVSSAGILGSTAPLPVISSFTPSEGYTGTDITISGTNLSATSGVSINGNPALSFTVINDNTVQAKVGHNSQGTVLITTPGSYGMSPSQFNYKGYKTANNGNWSNGNTWFGGQVPQSGSPIQIDHNVTVDNSINLNSTITVSGNTTLKLADTLKNTGTTIVNGNLEFINSGNLLSNVIFAAIGDQQITGSSLPKLGSLQINKPSGKLVTSSGFNISNNLTLTKGNIEITDATKKIHVGGTINRTDGHIIGSLSRQINSGNSSVLFPIGTVTGYTPAQINFDAVLGTGPFMISSNNGKGPRYPIGYSGSQYLDRNWIVSTNLQFSSATASLNFLPGDVVGTTLNELKGYYFINNYIMHGSSGNPFSFSGTTFSAQMTSANPQTEFGAGAYESGSYMSAFYPKDGYFHTSFSITGVNLRNVTAVKIGGVDLRGYVVINENWIKGNVGVGTTGVVTVETSDRGTLTLPDIFTHYGFTTQTDGEWNDPATWNGYQVPPPGARVVIKHNVSYNGAFTNTAEVIVDTASSFRVDVPYANNGILRMSGTLEIGANGSFSGNPPIYAKDTSALRYNTNGTFNVGSEWTSGSSVSGEGIPENVTISNCTVNLPSANRKISKNLNLLNGTLALNNSGGDLTVNGNINVQNGNVVTNGRNIVVSGNEDQSIGGNGATPQWNNLTVNKTSGKLILPDGLSLDGNLTLTNGIVVIRDQSKKIHVSGSITRTNGYVDGKLSRTVTTGSPNLNFPVGTVSGYTPVNLAFTNVAGNGPIVVHATDGKSANYPSGFSTTKNLGRYWTVTTGISFSNANAVFEFLPGDMVGGVTTSSLRAFKYNGSFTFPASGNFTISGTTYTYNNITSFSEFGAGQDLSSLPVTLISFNVSVFDVAKSRLSWSTGTELNFSKFIIEKSKNGSDFTAIGTIMAKGDNSIYGFEDELQDAITYYRLKMVDIDGKTSFSKVVSVTTGFVKNQLLMSPNPAINIVTVIHPKTSRASSVAVTTLDGRDILRQSVEAGADKTNIDLSMLPAGIYLLNYVSPDDKKTLKFVKL